MFKKKAPKQHYQDLIEIINHTPEIKTPKQNKIPIMNKNTGYTFSPYQISEITKKILEKSNQENRNMVMLNVDMYNADAMFGYYKDFYDLEIENLKKQHIERMKNIELMRIVKERDLESKKKERDRLIKMLEEQNAKINEIEDKLK